MNCTHCVCVLYPSSEKNLGDCREQDSFIHEVSMKLCIYRDGVGKRLSLNKRNNHVHCGRWISLTPPPSLTLHSFILFPFFLSLNIIHYYYFLLSIASILISPNKIMIDTLMHIVRKTSFHLLTQIWDKLYNRINVRSNNDQYFFCPSFYAEISLWKRDAFERDHISIIAHYSCLRIYKLHFLIVFWRENYTYKVSVFSTVCKYKHLLILLIDESHDFAHYQGVNSEECRWGLQFLHHTKKLRNHDWSTNWDIRLEYIFILHLPWNKTVKFIEEYDTGWWITGPEIKEKFNGKIE